MNSYSFFGSLLLAVAVTAVFQPSFNKPLLMKPPPGLESFDTEDPNFMSCLIKTACDLGDEMFKRYTACFAEAKAEDIDFAKKEFKVYGGDFNVSETKAVIREYCTVLDEEKKNESLLSLLRKNGDRLMEICRSSMQRCQDYKKMADCSMNLIVKNKEEKKCD